MSEVPLYMAAVCVYEYRPLFVRRRKCLRATGVVEGADEMRYRGTSLIRKRPPP